MGLGSGVNRNQETGAKSSRPSICDRQSRMLLLGLGSRRVALPVNPQSGIKNELTHRAQSLTSPGSERQSGMAAKVEVYNDGEQWCARGIGADLFTCARSFDELMVEVKDAAACYFHDQLQMGETLNLLSLTEAEVRHAAPVAADRR
jgi:hypothetical protein